MVGSIDRSIDWSINQIILSFFYFFYTRPTILILIIVYVCDILFHRKFSLFSYSLSLPISNYYHYPFSFSFLMRKYFENFPMMERVLNFFFFGLSFLNKIDHFFKILIIIFYFIFFSLFWKFKISLNRTTSTKIFNNIPPLFFFVLCFFVVVVVLIHITATQKKNFSQFFSISSWSLLLK